MRWSVSATRWGRRPRTYRPDSYSLDAMGEISEWIVMRPSSGRSGWGFTIFASTCARTLLDTKRDVEERY